jgi:hypothetical protein
MDTRDLIKQMMADVLDGQTADAQERFEDIISVKVTDALEAQKQSVASNLYAQEEE